MSTKPSLTQRIISVMGTKVMTKQQVYDALEAKGWLPDSADPLKYVGYTLSAARVCLLCLGTEFEPINPGERAFEGEPCHSCQDPRRARNMKEDDWFEVFRQDLVKGRGYYHVMPDLLPARPYTS